MGLPEGPEARPPTPGRLAYEVATLQKFKKRVDTLREGLAFADPAIVNNVDIPASDYGTNFAEADALARLYNTVLTELETFSRTFTEQIEALSLAIDLSERSYAEVDEETRQRMRAIQQRTTELYREPNDQPHQAHAPRSGDGETSQGWTD